MPQMDFSAVLMAVFVAIERKIEEPMLPLGFFRNSTFTGAQIAAFAVSASQFALFLYLTFYLQNFLGYSPFEAGLRYLPISVASFVAAAATGSRGASPAPVCVVARARSRRARVRAAGDVGGIRAPALRW